VCDWLPGATTSDRSWCSDVSDYGVGPLNKDLAETYYAAYNSGEESKHTSDSHIVAVAPHEHG
jgi:hypothetical protein